MALLMTSLATPREEMLEGNCCSYPIHKLMVLKYDPVCRLTFCQNTSAGTSYYLSPFFEYLREEVFPYSHISSAQTIGNLMIYILQQGLRAPLRKHLLND